MNTARRKRIEEAITLVENAKDIIDDCLSEEQDYLDNMPENLQYSEKHDIAENAVDCLQCASDSIDSALDSLNSATD